MNCEHQVQNLELEVSHNERFFLFVPKKKLKVIRQGGLEVLMRPTPQLLLSNQKNRSQLFIDSCNHKPFLVMKNGLAKKQTLIPKGKGFSKKINLNKLIISNK
jgi:hypothetical protein